MNPQTLVETILDENRNLLTRVSKEQVDYLVKALDNSERIFCAAQGRSGYILRCFCMRLMQFGYQTFFVGETITPKIGKGDMLIVLSGSGQTNLTQEWIRVARQQGATTFGIIGVEDSPIGRALDYSLSLPAGSKLGFSGASSSIQPPGSLFEQAAFVLLETIVLALYQMRGCDPQGILDHHANLE
ncbi:MAG: SIS domain-containing protein [Deltaproteobacteria bacterium]|mgnify:CR=1 FL=1|nr:SIS domain-containing protein [Deltaproteobacteria bacterium]MBW2018726.1 SIS domain-containing protein [Deltaproteobacteria bacterium]MBW2073455.1 SIS domain-containing protein [Deltaproteobacteria bacterium]RLB83039.1 MAG: 6-phospho-3-hexuloisomerase [Deltaproteobacteria bacterium]